MAEQCVAVANPRGQHRGSQEGHGYRAAALAALAAPGPISDWPAFSGHIFRYGWNTHPLEAADLLGWNPLESVGAHPLEGPLEAVGTLANDGLRHSITRRPLPFQSRSAHAPSTTIVVACEPSADLHGGGRQGRMSNPFRTFPEEVEVEAPDPTRTSFHTASAGRCRDLRMIHELLGGCSPKILPRRQRG